MTRAALVVLGLGVSSAGCSDGGDGAANAAAPDGGYAVCPPGLDASFDELRTRMFATRSCGADQAHNCHSTSGAAAVGTFLDFTLDAGAVYAELLGPDGGGQPAANVAGDAKVLRVVPHDAGASMLYIKLTLKTAADPHYGAGMPFTAPGSVCPEALDAVRAWIDQGARP